MSEHQAEDIRVRMLREDLEDVPRHEPPDGYTMRFYRDGDRRVWERLWVASDACHSSDPERFRRAFRDDLAALARRCMFLVSPEGQAVGTVTAWYAPRYRHKRWGMIHYVAIDPQYQGRRLAKPMLAAAMNRLAELGHCRALLNTESRRLRAIRVYLGFGFRPDMSRPDAHRAWSDIARHLGRPLPLLGARYSAPAWVTGLRGRPARRKTR